MMTKSRARELLVQASDSRIKAIGLEQALSDSLNGSLVKSDRIQVMAVVSALGKTQGIIQLASDNMEKLMAIVSA